LLVAQFASPTKRRVKEYFSLRGFGRAGVVANGCRESRYATQSLIFSADNVVYRQLFALWCAGVMVALLTGLGTGFDYC